MPSPELGGSDIGRGALQIAIDELNAGAGEIGGNNCGPFVNKYLNGLAREGASWCAAFVSYCYLNSGFEMPFTYSVSARELFNQLNRNSWILKSCSMPTPGDIVFWWRENENSWKGHAGLVHHCHNEKLYTIEGNRTPKVAGFLYDFTRIAQLLGFGQVPDFEKGLS